MAIGTTGCGDVLWGKWSTQNEIIELQVYSLVAPTAPHCAVVATLISPLAPLVALSFAGVEEGEACADDEEAGTLWVEEEEVAVGTSAETDVELAVGGLVLQRWVVARLAEPS